MLLSLCIFIRYLIPRETDHSSAYFSLFPTPITQRNTSCLLQLPLPAARMSLQLIVLLLAALTVSMVQSQNVPLVFRANRPRNALTSNMFLKLDCTFDKSKSFLTTVTSLKIVRSKIVPDMKPYHLVAEVKPAGLEYGLPESLIQATGEIGAGPKSQVTVTYKNKVAGYCFSYVCKAEGVDANGAEQFVYRKIRLSSPESERCMQKPTPKPAGSSWLFGN
ncbi:hypothetical protein PoB_002630300 [Plakobranchus ocellatus]|uniref:Uncharacterized protein n=1 Tax=Plakobranchus ocellatus TaxID=259542 RepID=A0AAV3ZY27_9GAST|nr:hypothetical protein PoB_002630300 [Plakobranchus ocellatus]